MQAITKFSATSIFVLLFSVCLSPAKADPPCYDVVGGELTSGLLCEGAVTIDSSVTSIRDNAFEYNTNISSISIPSSVSQIGSYAFAASGLTSVTIPGTVTSIGTGAFQQMPNLTSVIIQEGITTLPLRAFYNNFSPTIANISLPNTLTSIGESAFRGAAITSLTIPNSVTSIGGSAFERSLLTSVVIGESVEEIGDNAFYLTDLTTLTIPNSVNYIGESAFEGTSLTSVVIGEGVEQIGISAFYETDLTTLTIPNSVTTIGSYAFAVNRALTSITIGSGVTNIGSYAFIDNSGLTSISFLGNQPTIGTNAFFSIPSGVVASVPATADGFETDGDGLWNGFSISRVVAPSISLSPISEEKTVNTGITGYTIGITGDTVTSFSISPAAPSGLSFNTSTGILTGTPNSVAPATTFTITARNVGGSSTATFTLTVRAVSRASENTDDEAAAEAAAERAAAAQQAARAGILAKLRTGEELTVESFAQAGIWGVTSRNFQEFQAELRGLPESSRSDINEILKIAYKFEIVDRIGSERVNHLPPKVFIEISLIDAGNENKVALVAAVRKLPLAARDSFAEIRLAIEEQMIKIQARKDRLAAVIARNAQRSLFSTQP